MKAVILLCSIMVPVAGSLAGDAVALDKDFHFDLAQSAPASHGLSEQSLEAPAPARSESVAPSRTPLGEKLPRGLRAFEFNGAPCYVIPL